MKIYVLVGMITIGLGAAILCGVNAYRTRDVPLDEQSGPCYVDGVYVPSYIFGTNWPSCTPEKKRKFIQDFVDKQDGTDHHFDWPEVARNSDELRITYGHPARSAIDSVVVRERSEINRLASMLKMKGKPWRDDVKVGIFWVLIEFVNDAQITNKLSIVMGCSYEVDGVRWRADLASPGIVREFSRRYNKDNDVPW